MSSNFPNGFTSSVTIRGIPLQQLHPGEVFWVNNSSVLAYGQDLAGSNGNEGTFTKPFSTITYALTKCKASRGDIIMLGVGHNEDVAEAAAAGLTFDVAGVAIVGTGVGSLRSAITQTLADTTIDVTADNISFANISFEAGFADVATGLNVSDVDGLSFDNCYWTEGAAAGTFNYLDFIDLATGASNFSMNRCYMFGRDANDNSQIVQLATDGFYLTDCVFFNAVAQGAISANFIGTDVTNIDVKRCNFYNNKEAATCVAFSGTCSGVWRDCTFGSLDSSGFMAGGADATGSHFFNCVGSGEANKWGAPMGGAAIYNNA